MTTYTKRVKYNCILYIICIIYIINNCILVQLNSENIFCQRFDQPLGVHQGKIKQKADLNVKVAKT